MYPVKATLQSKFPLKAFLLSSLPLCSFASTAFLFKSQTRGKAIERISRMRSLLNSSDTTTPDYPDEKWDQLWKEGTTPWDLGGPTCLLSDELHKRLNDNWNIEGQSFRSFVPGCGSGYDLYSIARWQESILQKHPDVTSTVVGLDISNTSLQRSNQVLSQLLLSPDSTAGTTSSPSSIALYNGDFFSTNASWKLECVLGTTENSSCIKIDNDTFDFIFDYTFFCAINPQLRPQWAQRMSQLLKPKGKLLTLIFPIFPAGSPEMVAMEGPPFPVSVNAYEEVLKPWGFQIMEGCPFENSLTVDRRKGKEMVCWWQKM